MVEQRGAVILRAYVNKGGGAARGYVIVVVLGERRRGVCRGERVIGSLLPRSKVDKEVSAVACRKVCVRLEAVVAEHLLVVAVAYRANGVGFVVGRGIYDVSRGVSLVVVFAARKVRVNRALYVVEEGVSFEHSRIVAVVVCKTESHFNRNHARCKVAALNVYGVLHPAVVFGYV